MGVTPHVRTCMTHFYIARTAGPIVFKLCTQVKANIQTISTSYVACNSTGSFTNGLWLKPAQICQYTCARAASVTHILIGENMGHVISEMLTKFQRNRSNCFWDMLLKSYRKKKPLIFRRFRSVQSRFILSMLKVYRCHWDQKSFSRLGYIYLLIELTPEVGSTSQFSHKISRDSYLRKQHITNKKLGKHH